MRYRIAVILVATLISAVGVTSCGSGEQQSQGQKQQVERKDQQGEQGLQQGQQQNGEQGEGQVEQEQLQAHVDKIVGENWVDPGVPPPHQDAYNSPNVALMEEDALWEHISQADPGGRRVLIALKPATKDRGFFHGTSLMSSTAVKNQKERLLDSIPDLREAYYRPAELPNGTELPVFAAKIGSKTALEKLQKSPSVDYVEPQVILFESVTCGADAYKPSSDPRARDERLSGPFSGEDLVPYSYRHHHVQDAWARLGDHPGEGQGIAVLDTGVSSTQQQFFSRYAAYYSRMPHLRLNVTTESENDRCSHGTKVASVAAAPRDGRNIVGIAWRAPLTTVKTVINPLATKGSVSAICRGIAEAVNPPDGRPPARVVVMGFGLTYFSPSVAECIASAYRTSPNTLFVAAAGSGFTEVMFPANLNDFVTAVSMVEFNPNGSGYRLMGRPFTVAYGPSVDFVSAYAEPTRIPASGLRGDEEVDEVVTFGLSSASTGMYAGLIPLASQYAESRGWNREQLMAALKLSASKENIRDFSGEPVQAVVGAGILDVYRATGGARKAVIKAPYQARPGETVTLEAETDAIVPPGAAPPDHFRYRWTVNDTPKGTGRTKTIQAPSSGPMRIQLSVLDTVDKKRLTASHQIEIVPEVASPERRTLYWSSYVADWATFFNGGRHDRVVNAGQSMPEGCIVEGVRGLLMANIGGRIQPAPGESPQVSIHRGGFGFTVSRPIGLRPNDLEVLVHQWHDGFNGVRTKVVYDILQPPGVDCTETVPDRVLATSP